MEIKELECKSCGANMEIDYKKNVLVCPYCGAREIIVDPGKVREPEQKKSVKAKKNKKGLMIVIAVLIGLAALLIIAVATYSITSTVKEEKRQHTAYTWPTTGLATMIPKPEEEFGEIYDYNDSFSIEVFGSSMDSFRNYVDKCKELGFTIDEKSYNTSYRAYNEEGYPLEVYYSSYDGSLDIDIEQPLKMSTIYWSYIDAFQLLPAPESDQGKIDYETEEYATAHIGNTTKEDYLAYIKACKEAGFTEETINGDDYYYAYHKSKNWSLRLEYEGFNIMRVETNQRD